MTAVGYVDCPRCRPDFTNLTDAPVIAVDASVSDRFTVTITADRALGDPSGAADGQPLFFRIIQDGVGAHTITLGAKFNDPNAYFTGLAAGANARNYLGVVYCLADDQFDVLAFSAGY